MWADAQGRIGVCRPASPNPDHATPGRAAIASPKTQGWCSLGWVISERANKAKAKAKVNVKASRTRTRQCPILCELDERMVGQHCPTNAGVPTSGTSGTCVENHPIFTSRNVKKAKGQLH